MWKCKKMQSFLYSASFFKLLIPAFAHAAAINDCPLSKKVNVTLSPENAHKIILNTVTGVGNIDKARIYTEDCYVIKTAVLEVL
jgi:hypothetical protein